MNRKGSAIEIPEDDVFELQVDQLIKVINDDLANNGFPRIFSSGCDLLQDQEIEMGQHESLR